MKKNENLLLKISKDIDKVKLSQIIDHLLRENGAAVECPTFRCTGHGTTYHMDK